MLIITRKSYAPDCQKLMQKTTGYIIYLECCRHNGSSRRRYVSSYDFAPRAHTDVMHQALFEPIGSDDGTTTVQRFVMNSNRIPNGAEAKIVPIADFTLFFFLVFNH